MDTTDLIEIPTGIPRRLTKKYTENFGSFETWCAGHRAHQVLSVNACQGQRIGQISLPTGTGKTRVQIHLHVESMIEGAKIGDLGVYVIASHRLALNAQLLDEMTKVLVASGVPIDLFFIGSDRYSEDFVYEKFKNLGVQKGNMSVGSGTQRGMIERAYESAMSNKRHLVCVSTYHSFAALDAVPVLKMCTYDEAHTLMSDEFREDIDKVKPKIQRNFFFTATRRIMGDTGGMNDTDWFGNVLYEESPRAMIDAGEIIPPKFHILRPTESGDFSNYSMLIRSVLEAFEKHKRYVKHFSCAPTTIGAKLLVSTTGNKELFEIHDDPDFRTHVTREGIDVFAFSSDKGCFVNFVTQPRAEVVRRMRGLPDTADALLLHIDILTEGIDLPTITGVMPFRELGKAKLLQTIGRGARLFPHDREMLYNDSLKPGNYESFVKPYCWIVLPEFFSSIGDADLMKERLFTIFNAYAIPVEEFMKSEQYIAVVDEDADRITDRETTKHRDAVCEIDHIMQDILFSRVNRDRLRELVEEDD